MTNPVRFDNLQLWYATAKNQLKRISDAYLIGDMKFNKSLTVTEQGTPNMHSISNWVSLPFLDLIGLKIVK